MLDDIFSDAVLGSVKTDLALQIIAKTFIMYFCAVFILRMLGKRGLSHLSLFEFVILLAMGTSVGDPMMHKDISILQGSLALGSLVVVHRLFSKLTEKFRKFELVVEGKARCLVKNGKINKEVLESEHLSLSELLIGLREKGIEDLTVVKRAYLEPSGNISVIEAGDPPRSPRISILPEDLEHEKTPDLPLEKFEA